MFLLITAPTCFGLSSWPLSGNSKVCAACMSTYWTDGFTHMIKIIIKIELKF